MKPLPKEYDHKTREKFWQERWFSGDVYHFHDDQPRDKTFVIDTPPPTVSGVLHMGHIFSYTQADFVARYQRMIGKDVFYPIGFDDNGLPTERLVEKEKKIRATDYIKEHGREGFIKLCKEVVVAAEEEFRRLFKSAALSVDWRQEYQTISNEVMKLSQESFLDLLKKGEAYRKLQPMLWDPVDQTAIAQAEIVDKEMPSHFNDIVFTVDGSDEKIIIGTTRPELIGACVAVFYHPDDVRYKHLKGKTAVTPLFGVKVPILADDAVKLDKGTGLVMCCTFGDETDIMWWQKHNLPTKVILNKYGKIEFWWHYYTTNPDNITITQGFKNILADATVVQITTANSESDDNWNDNYSENFDDYKTALSKIDGLKVSNSDPKHPGAREIIIQMLKEQDLLVKQEPTTHAVKCAERSGAVLEILPTYQWFVKVLDKKEVLTAKVKECQWHPEYMRIRAEQWIDGLNWDWCISRQRFFGVPFPVWYVYDFVEMTSLENTNNEILLKTAVPDIDELPIIDPLNYLPKELKTSRYKPIEKLQHPGTWHLEDIETGKHLLVRADKDVMDTWATSSLTPQISARAIGGDSARYKKLFPADIRPQAHEIIRTWAFYTIVKSHLHAATIPWKNLMISGWCLAPDKTKMSKSKGNVITPVDLIEEKGTDAVRYWASTSRLGADTAFSEDLLKIGRKLVTKLWNASNFASLNLHQLQGIPSTPMGDKAIITEALDIWILSRLHQCIKKATQEFEQFEYCDARVAIEDFFWNDFCDNYLEMVKVRAYGESGNQQSALYTLHHCLDAILRLFAPFVPHITEEIYSHIFEGKGSIHARGQWPCAEDYIYDAAAEKAGMAAVDILNVIRKAKSEANVSIKFPVEKVELFAKDGAAALKDLEPLMGDLKSAASAETIVPAPSADLPLLSEKGWYAARVTLGQNIEKAASN
jgi:valyl-tRNA synthetase